MSASLRPPQHTGVVGGGILGLAVARRLLQTRPASQVTVLEKENRLAAHQTGRNSGVVHAGIYYTPGSLKSRLCRRGVELLREFADTHGIVYDRCGKVIVALRDDELPTLDRLYERALANGVPGVTRLEPAQLRDVEPHATGLAAVHSPETAIIDFTAVTAALAQEIRTAGGTVNTGHEVTGIREQSGSVLVDTTNGQHVFSHLVICAGLHGDRVARLAGADGDPQIVPFRGEYDVLSPDRRHLVKGLIYPVPDPRYPFLGVHLTRRFDGEVLVGPNAVPAFAREGYRTRDISLQDATQMLRWPGFWRMAGRHWRTGVCEFLDSLRRHAFAQKARQFIPDLRDDDLLDGPAGVRAQAVARDGTLVDDFRIDDLGRVTAVRNAPSPGATSSLAIAEYIVDRLKIA